MIVGLLAMTIVRCVITAIGILLIGAAFGATAMTSFPEFVFWIVLASTIFGLLGILVGLWANNFEQLTMPAGAMTTGLGLPAAAKVASMLWNAVVQANDRKSFATLNEKLVLRSGNAKPTWMTSVGPVPNGGGCWLMTSERHTAASVVK